MTDSQDERLGLPSASSWRRFELCPGSYQLSLEAEKLNQLAHQGGEAAERGERIHAWLAGTPTEDGEEIKLSDDEAVTAEFLMERATEQRIRIFGDEKVEQLSERRLWLYLNGRKAASGRFDRVIYTEKLALIQDFKSGQSEPQEAEISSQMRVLAVLVGLALPSVKEIAVQIISVFYGVSERRFLIKDLAEAYRDLVKTLHSISTKDPPLNAGVEQCVYCSAQAICPANRKLLTPLTKFAVTQLPDDPVRASRLLDEITILRDCFDQIESWYKKLLSDNPAAKIVGYGLVPNAPRRAISDVAKAKLRLMEFLDEAELDKATSMTLGDLEEALGKKLGLRGKDLKDKFNSILQGLITEKIPQPSLKRIGGKPKFTEAALEQQMVLSDKAESKKNVQVILP